MPRVDPTFHFIRLPKVSLGPALNSFKYLLKAVILSKMTCCPSKMHTHILIMSVTSMQSYRYLKLGIEEFHRKYALVPADKAANNVVVV